MSSEHRSPSVSDESAADPSGLERMHRLHPMTLVHRFLVSIPALFVILLPVLRNPDANAWFSFGMLILYGVFVIPLIIVQYVRFQYAVKPTEIIIQKGVFTTQHRSIPIERIQNIEIEQKLLPRLLGTSKVKIETAGSSSTEGVIEYVSVEQARAIRATVRAYQRVHEESARPPVTTDIARPEKAEAAPSLFEMTTGRALLSGVFRFSLLYIVVIFSATEYLGVTPEDVARWLTGDRLGFFTAAMESSPIAVIFATVVMIALLAWITGIVTNFNRFYRFQLVLEGDKLHSRRGLLTVSEGTIPLKKIQAFMIRTNPLMSAFGWYRLELQTMGFDPDDRGYRVAAPFARLDEVMAIARAIRPVEDPGVLESVSKLMIRRTFVRYALVLMAAAAAVGFVWTNALWAVAGLPVLFVLAVLHYRYHGFRASTEYLFVRRGIFRRTTWIMPVERFQVFYLTQTIFQRRLRLQSVYVDTAGAGVMAHPVVMDLPADHARELVAFLHRAFYDHFAGPASRPTVSSPG